MIEFTMSSGSFDRYRSIHSIHFKRIINMTIIFNYIAVLVERNHSKAVSIGTGRIPVCLAI